MPPGTYRNITGNLALAYGLVAGGVQSGLPVFLGSYPITPASDILHELSQAQVLRRHHVPGRGRDRRRRRRDRRVVRRPPRRHHHLGPRHRAEVRGDRPRRDDRAAARRRRRPARRPLDRACRPRPSRPTCCRRCSAATARRRCRSWRPSPPATASTRPSRPPGSPSPTAPRSCCSPTATSPTAPSRGGSPAVDDLPVIDPDFATEKNHTVTDDGRHDVRVLALPARRRDPRPAVGDPGHRRPRAPHRRPREGRRARQHLLRPRQPRLHGPHPPGQGRPDRRLAAAARGRRPVRRGQGAGPRLGLDLRPDRRRRTPRAQGRLPGRPGAPAPPQPVPEATSARSSSATTRCWCPR